MKQLNTRRAHYYIALMMLGLAFAPIVNAQVLQLNVPANVKKIVINDYFTDYQFYDGMLAIDYNGNYLFIFVADEF